MAWTKPSEPEEVKKAKDKRDEVILKYVAIALWILAALAFGSLLLFKK